MSELVRVTLAKDWNKHKDGSTISVDSVRASWLQRNGYTESVRAKVDTPRVKKSGRVSKPKTD